MVCYETDASRMKGIVEKVIFPKTIEELQTIVKIAKLDIVPRGAGSGLVGGAIPNNSIVIDMGKMNKVTNFLPLRKSVRVESGISLKELNEKLNSIGYEFPIDSPKKGIETIGGMIARNASGERSMRYGSIREWIEEIEFINGKGELAKTSKADLTDVCGMEGITGIIVAATIKLTPIIKRSASIFQSDNIDEILSIARKLKSEREVVLLELFSPYVSKLLGFPEKYNLIIEFNSARGKIKGKDYYDISKTRENSFYKLASAGYYNMEDPKFFYDKIREFIVFLEENKIPYVGHLGSGIIHPYFKDNEEEKRESVIEFIKKSKATPGRFGIGLSRKYFIDNFQEKLIQRVKSRHDPHYKFNKGKIIGIQGYNIHKKTKIVDNEFLKEAVEDSEVKKIPKETIKEITGEQLSAAEVMSETSECDAEKTPEEKLENFIKEIELKDKIAEKISEEIKEPEINKESVVGNTSANKESSVSNRIVSSDPSNELSFQEDMESPSNELSFQEVGEKLKDYEDTFTSEMQNEKMQEIEKFAKNIPREIVKNEIEFRPKEKANVDYNQIRNIMTNRVSKGNVVNEIKQDNEEIRAGKVSVSDNLDRKNELTQEDRELIDKIIGNKYKRSDVENKNVNDENKNKNGGEMK